MKPVLHKFPAASQLHKGFVAQQLRRGIPGQEVDDIPLQLLALQGVHGHLSGRNVRKAKGNAVPGSVCSPKKVVGGIVQHTAFDEGTRRHQPDHVPFHQSLGKGRILHLLTDRHLIPQSDQPFDVDLAAVEGHAAHGGTLLQAAVPAGEGQLQQLGYQHSVIEKHFVEISQTEEQNGVAVFLLDRHILLHHRG